VSLCKFAHFRGGFRGGGDYRTGPDLISGRRPRFLRARSTQCVSGPPRIHPFTQLYTRKVCIYKYYIPWGRERAAHTRIIYIIYILCTCIYYTYRDAATRKRNAVHNVHSTSRLINYSRRVLLNYRIYIYMPGAYTAVVTVLFFDFFSLLLLLFPAGQRRVPDTHGRIYVYTFNVYIGADILCVYNMVKKEKQKITNAVSSARYTRVAGHLHRRRTYIIYALRIRNTSSNHCLYYTYTGRIIYTRV